MPSWFPVLASSALAFIPVLIWLRLIPREGEGKSLYLKTFLFGTLAVLPPFALIFLFKWFPAFNIYSLINRQVEEVALAALLTNIIVGIIEEIAKNLIVRIIDKRHPEYIQTITSALKLSLCAGLGFSFAENIFYFHNIWISPQYGSADLFTTFVFRSVFTMCAHMVFSGIFGYYFGIGKFAPEITQTARFEGTSMRFTRFLAKHTGKLTFQILREEKNLTGLFFAMGLHALFNVSLDLQHKLPSLAIVITSAIFIRYLLQTKTGHLLFSITKRRASSMTASDEDVVLELLGMWLREGRLEAVMSICDRLLLRDPDNNVVKLFRAKAADNQKLQQVYSSLKALFTKSMEPEFSVEKAPSKTLSVQDEKLVLEVMSMWYKEGKTMEVLEVANRLLTRNPDSQGAKVLLEKAMDKEKLKKLFEAIGKLFLV